MSGENEILLNAVVALVPPLLRGLEALAFIARRLHPPQIADVVGSVGVPETDISTGLDVFRAVDWPPHLAAFRKHIERASEEVLKAFAGLRAAIDDPEGVFGTYRAMRYMSRALEALYPVSAMLPPVSQFFLDAEARDDKALVARLADADRRRADVGVMHVQNEKNMRGGFSLYVPEYYDPAVPIPLVMALHGGSGHGRDFLWSWVREARTRGAILVSPTAIGSTWSLMEGEIDGENIERILDHVRGRWAIDERAMLLTGMSDGGTFSYISGLRDASPFTHLAPVSASFHPFLLEMTTPARIGGLPIYLVHGVLDWMFPVDMARVAYRALAGAGADVTYRELSDLSHTYPREENARIMDWLVATG